MIATRKLKNDINSVNSVQESLRQARLDITRLRRSVVENLQRAQNQEIQESILSNYVKSMEELRKIGPKFTEMIRQNRQDSLNSMKESFKLQNQSGNTFKLPMPMINEIIETEINFPSLIEDSEEIDD